MVTLVALVVWRSSVYLVLPAFLIFGTLDGLYLSSALTKVPDGAWFTLCLAVILSSIFVLWRFGKENQWHAEAEDKIAVGELLSQSSEHHVKEDREVTELRIKTGAGEVSVSRLRGIGVFFDKTGLPNAAPTVFVHFLQKFQAAHAVNIFFHIRPLSCPTVAPEDRFSVSRCGSTTAHHDSDGGRVEKTPLKHFYRVTVRHGYADNVISSEMGLSIYEHLRDFIIRDASSEASPSDSDASNAVEESNTDPMTSRSLPSSSQQQQDRIRRELGDLQQAFEDQVVYIVGKEQMRIASLGDLRDGTAATTSSGGRQIFGQGLRYSGAMARKVFLAAFLWLRSNTGSRVANMDLEVEKLVEVGFVKII